MNIKPSHVSSTLTNPSTAKGVDHYRETEREYQIDSGLSSLLFFSFLSLTQSIPHSRGASFWLLVVVVVAAGQRTVKRERKFLFYQKITFIPALVVVINGGALAREYIYIVAVLAM